LQQAESVDLEAGLSEEEKQKQQKQLQMNNTSRRPLTDELYQEKVTSLDEDGVFGLALELKTDRNEKTTLQIYRLLQEIAVKQQAEMVAMRQEISQLKGMVQKIQGPK
jgi:polyhydroxyalkanoate synthesis regulator phasin